MHKIRYGVIGIKGIGQHHARLTRTNPHVELTALADVDENAVSHLAKQYGTRAFTDYRDMLDAGILDAVTIATPHHLHREMGMACLEAGLHVLMEKPLANRVSEADALIAAAKSKKLKLGVGHQYRAHRLSTEMKRVIDAGTLGRLLRVLWTWTLFRSEAYYRRDTWRSTWDQGGGGVLMYQASHDLDLVSWMIGKPVQVSALIGNQLHEPALEDIASANILFENGIIGTFQATINQPEGYSVRQIAGDKGMLVVQDVHGLFDDCDETMLIGSFEDNLSTLAARDTDYLVQPHTEWHTVTWRDPKKLTFLDRAVGKFNRVVLRKMPPIRYSPRMILIDNFVDAILNGKELLVSGESARNAIEIVNACVLSGVRKKVVDLPVDRQEYDELFEELSGGRARIPRFR